MPNFLIILIVGLVVFAIFKFIKPEKTKKSSSQLLSKLKLDKLPIEKHKEAAELIKLVNDAKQDDNLLLPLQEDVENLIKMSSTELAELHFDKAENYFKDKATYKALMYYNKAIDLKKDSKYFNNRACLWHSKDDFEIAIDDYTQAIILNPNYGKYYYNRGGAYYAVKRDEEARRDWEKALDMGIAEAENMLRFYF
jgi:tetratricopeptide (TPR) repeat protein